MVRAEAAKSHRDLPPRPAAECPAVRASSRHRSSPCTCTSARGVRASLPAPSVPPETGGRPKQPACAGHICPECQCHCTSTAMCMMYAQRTTHNTGTTHNPTTPGSTCSKHIVLSVCVCGQAYATRRSQQSARSRSTANGVSDVRTLVCACRTPLPPPIYGPACLGVFWPCCLEVADTALLASHSFAALGASPAVVVRCMNRLSVSS